MTKISIVEVERAMRILHIEVQTTEGCEAWELLRDYINQQREKQIKEGTLIVQL
jgi:hypothetical protein